MGRGDAVLGRKMLLEMQAEDEEGGAGEADGSVRCQVSGLQEGEIITQGSSGGTGGA